MTFDPKRKVGPNVKKLIVSKMSRDAVPSGGGIADVIGFLSSPDKLVSGMREAADWVFASIDAVKSAPGGDKFGGDEAIAAEILRQIDERKKQQAKDRAKRDSD